MVSEVPKSGGFVPGASPVDLRPVTPPQEIVRPSPRTEPDLPDSPEKDQTKIDPTSIQNEIESLNKLMEGLGNRLEFGLFENTDRLFVKIVDRRQNQVVKMLPSEDFLRLKQKIADAIGLVIDEEI